LKKIVTLLTVTVLFLLTFFNLILDAPQTSNIAHAIDKAGDPTALSSPSSIPNLNKKGVTGTIDLYFGYNLECGSGSESRGRRNDTQK
jgi:hypothetical protein